MHKHLQPGDFWLLTTAAILWGTIGVATQAIYNIDNTTSLFINLGRSLIATLVLLVACWRIIGRSTFAIPKRDFLIMVLSGSLLAVSHAAYFAAIRASGVTITTLITICVAPLVVTGVSVLLKSESLNRRNVLALIFALLGVALLVGFDAPDGDNLFLGVFFSLIAAASYASMIICGRFLAGGYHPLQVTAVNFGAGTLLLAVINLAAGIMPVQTSQGWLLIAYLGHVPSALAYWLFQKGLRSVPATAASIIGMLDPLVAALLAWLLFGETLAATGIIGATLLLASILFLSLDR